MGEQLIHTMGLKDEVEEAFAFFDKDDAGQLEWPIFEKMVQSLGETPTRNDLHLIWDEACPEGKADRAPVEVMWPKIEAKRKSKDQVRDAFRVFDNRVRVSSTKNSLQQCS